MATHFKKGESKERGQPGTVNKVDSARGPVRFSAGYTNHSYTGIIR